MKRSMRTLTAAVAAAVAFGVVAPAASATPPEGKGHVKAEPGGKGGKKDQGDKKAAQELRKVLRDIAKKDERLARAVKESRLSRLADDVRAGVLANVEADRAALAELAAAAQAADSTLDLRQVRKDLRDVRPENYVVVVNHLRFAAKLAKKIEAAGAELGVEEPPVEEPPVEEPPVMPRADLDDPVEPSTDPAGDLAAAAVSVASAVEKALAVTAASDKADLRAVKRDLQAAQRALAGVLVLLEGDGTVEPEPAPEPEPEPAPEPEPLPVP